jgi:hypothetical protein
MFPTFFEMQKITYTFVEELPDGSVRLDRSDGKRVKVSEDRFAELGRAKVVKMPAKALERPKEAARVPKLTKTPPTGIYSLCMATGDGRLAIMDSLNRGWTELLCYHYRMRCTLHLTRASLYPKDRVDEAIAFLQSFSNEVE